MEEQILFKEDGVLVTKKHFIVSTRTFTLDEIISLSFRELEARKWFAMLSLMTGVMLLIEESRFLIIGGILVIFGLTLALKAKPMYSLVITTKDGEKRVLTNEDSAYIQKVFNALDTAIADRSQPRETVPILAEETPATKDPDIPIIR